MCLNLPLQLPSFSFADRQHLEDALDFSLSPLEFMQKCFPDDFKEIEDARRAIGRYGLTGKLQVQFRLPTSLSPSLALSFPASLPVTDC